MATTTRAAGGARRSPVLRFGLPLLLAVLTVGGVWPASTAAQEWTPPRTVFVPRTGHTVDGLFLDAWREGRALLGDPLTEEVRVATGRGESPEQEQEQTVQYFENGALVFLPDQAPGEQVRGLDLGREALERALAERPSPALVAATRRTACGGGAECRGFGATGHTLDAGFRAFWENAGEERLLGRPLTEAFRSADGSWVQYFERAVLRARAGRGVEPDALGAAAAARQKVETGRVRRPAAVPVYAAALFDPATAPTTAPDPFGAPVPETLPVDPALAEEPIPAPVEEVVPEPVVPEVIGPGPQQGAYQEIVVSISAQTLWAYEGTQLVNSTLVSTGTAEVPETTTPVGSHAILSKVDVQDMEGTISGEYYYVPDVPYVMYFDGLGNALHGTYWHSNFGAPMSHGCVNLPMDVAAWIYGWASVGTALTVIP